MAATNQIQSTIEYDLFKVLGGNRSVNSRHVNRLASQMEQSGNITEVSPIIVNTNFEVIDGQHRLRAAEKAGVPVNYIVRPGLVVEDALQMNIVKKSWTPGDYLNLYVQQHQKQYEKFADILENHSWLTVTILLLIISGGDAKRKLRAFKMGDLEDFDTKIIEDRVNEIEEIARINPVFITGKMIKAYLSALSTPRFSHERFYENFKATGGIFRAQMQWFDNVPEILDIHNRKVAKI